jgi:raffinose/stachyose/melibiose transport system permease protein
VKLKNVIRHAVLIITSAVFLVPVYIALVNAFKPEKDILQNPLGMPIKDLTLENLISYGFSPYFNVLEGYWTTAVIISFSIFFILLFTSMLAYIMVRSQKARLSKFFYIMLLGGLIIPPQAILLSIVQILKEMGIMFTWQGLILRNIGWYIPFASFVYLGYIKTVSREMDDSAYIDGAGPARIFFKIIYPLIKPATASVIIFCFLWIWNDFLNPQIILGPGHGYTVTTGIYRAIGQYNTAWDQIFTLVLWASIPVLIMYAVMQKKFISGLTAGSLKG